MTPPLIWEPFDPAWLVALAREQLPDKPEIAFALSGIEQCAKYSVASWYFVDPTNPNKPGSEWQFKTNEHVFDVEQGPLVLDVLKDGRIGGVEFLDRL